jgi:hypothetical protein
LRIGLIVGTPGTTAIWLTPSEAARGRDGAKFVIVPYVGSARPKAVWPIDNNEVASTLWSTHRGGVRLGADPGRCGDGDDVGCCDTARGKIDTGAAALPERVVAVEAVAACGGVRDTTWSVISPVLVTITPKLTWLTPKDEGVPADCPARSSIDICFSMLTPGC